MREIACGEAGAWQTLTGDLYRYFSSSLAPWWPLVRDTAAADRAVEAGTDFLLMPRDVTTAVETVLAAVRSGRLSEARVGMDDLDKLAHECADLHTPPPAQTSPWEKAGERRDEGKPPLLALACARSSPTHLSRSSYDTQETTGAVCLPPPASGGIIR